MSNLAQIILESISSNFPISGNIALDNVLYAFIGVVAFSIAFNVVGLIFDFIGFYDSSLMSGVHWYVRVLIFSVIAYILRKVFQLVNWLIGIPIYVYLIIIILVILTHVIVHKTRSEKKSSCIEFEKDKEECFENEVREVKTKETVVQTRAVCPRCGGELVKRYGPYGSFWGCINFKGSEFGTCKYTRKFL